MNTGDKVIVFLMLFCIVCAVFTLVSYILYELLGIGEAYFSIIFFLCSMFGAACFMAVGAIFLNTGGV